MRPQFASNPGLWGERKRSTGAMALISERFLDTAIDAAATVHQTWLRVALEASGPSAGRAGAMTDTLEKLTSVRDAIAELCRNEAIRDLHLNGNPSNRGRCDQCTHWLSSELLRKRTPRR